MDDSFQRPDDWDEQCRRKNAEYNRIAGEYLAKHPEEEYDGDGVTRKVHLMGGMCCVECGPMPECSISYHDDDEWCPWCANARFEISDQTLHADEDIIFGKPITKVRE